MHAEARIPPAGHAQRVVLCPIFKQYDPTADKGIGHLQRNADAISR